MELTIHTIYDFVGGPLVWISFLVFIIGTIYQINRFFYLSKKVEEEIPSNVTGLPKKKSSGKTDRFSLKSISQGIDYVKDFFEPENLALVKVRTVLGVNPFVTVVTTIFHLCIVILPFFVYAHNMLLDESLGISFPSLPEAVTDIFTMIFLACAGYFLLRRLFVARVRAITTFYDFVILMIAVSPFITGYFAYHHMYDYKLMVILHILSGELMLMAIPFTKLVHMIYFFLNRFYIGTEYSFVRGSRTW